ncbi:prepilin-type N-terminal cleavage/methylation domain-containing protein [Cupriavidus necator]|uniref:Prepilin-type N-terminal cleavage/methylation domain-containing protein n=1 Tax=Cupriavidus necator TaxID=106590 RepID=A0A1U9US37_CUPNE|nr:prepilin-type N-terminal cleavage/methylation domain-containing protein [Cupriavidus necator]AQV95237.1 prepilin-type N-terminal cleavage/methylation domain-containing protein [Cupriavidus necator]
MQALRKPIRQRPRIRPRETGRSAGFALHEVLCALVVLGIGLMPMMGMAPGALSRQREFDTLAQAARLAAERAELEVAQPATCGGVPAFACPADARLIMAGRPGAQAGMPSIALWVRP